MIGEKATFWFITVAWIAAGLSSLLTGFFAYQSAAQLNPRNFVDAALLLGFAYGIFRKSRICAILWFAYYVIDQIALITIMHAAVTPDGLAGTAIFVMLCLMGIVGTFAWHRKQAPGR
ncbi:MAG: hypothetical protein ACLQBA_02250 [Candidatus Binataceae bacterium]